MYNWSDIKNMILEKLNMDQQQADALNFAGSFRDYCNEALIQISSSVKPKHTFYEIEIDKNNVNTLITMPEDFIGFGDDVNYLIYRDELINKSVRRIANDDDFQYVGTNQICFYNIGKYFISYDAFWFIPRNQSEVTALSIPMDILNCLPSYVASQCLKVDDESKSAILRNDFEILVARINDTNYKNTKNFRIEGDW